MKWTRTIIGLVIVLALLLLLRSGTRTAQLEQQVGTLQAEKTALVSFIQRLTAERRVAQVTVVRQYLDEANRPISVLRWQEIEPDGVASDPIEVEVIGDQAYFEAYVIKFDHVLVGRGDPDRGMSLALFRRVFGDQQAPHSATLLDRPRGALLSGLDDDASATALGRRLWERFWTFVDRPDIAAEFGIRVAQCEAPAVRLGKGETWELTLDADGGLNVRKVRAPLARRSARSMP